MPVYTYHNPFGDWANTGQSTNAPWASGSTAPPPSIFGVLPYPTPPSTSDAAANLTTFYLTSLNPTVLNCIVIGPRSRLHYQVTTDNKMPGYTVFKTAERKNVALIEWQKHPRVEIRDAVSKQETRSWLKISKNQTFRTMSIRGIEYTWSPDNQYINLCSSGPLPRFLARISRGDETVVIEMTPDAMQLGLLDTTVVVAVLLQCGHNID
ncbi:hypothetical protein B0H10DRAFT_86812 [Mycena sp. CBHHK59/15]|nr:hypothetical protein B0H10DRAFT_86812 [Mycena sp. CBHHK59/15]